MRVTRILRAFQREKHGGPRRRAKRAHKTLPTRRGLRREVRGGALGWFTRTEVRLEPRAISGREVAFTDGYSLLELERAGITEAHAIATGLTIDRARTSALGSNVLQLEQLRRARNLKGESSVRA
jgi:ribosomal protein L13E